MGGHVGVFGVFAQVVACEQAHPLDAYESCLRQGATIGFPSDRIRGRLASEALAIVAAAAAVIQELLQG